MFDLLGPTILAAIRIGDFVLRDAKIAFGLVSPVVVDFDFGQFDKNSFASTTMD